MMCSLWWRRCRRTAWLKLSIERLRTFSRLPRRERVIILRAWGLFLFLEGAIRIIPFTALLDLCQRLPKGGIKVLSDPSIARISWLVEVAARYIPTETTCLKQTLVLAWILGRQGIATTVQIGVARQDGILTAHAWLEHEGRPISEIPEAGRYAPLVRA
jgi:Transglutaminase-like superfamily